MRPLTHDVDAHQRGVSTKKEISDVHQDRFHRDRCCHSFRRRLPDLCRSAGSASIRTDLLLTRDWCRPNVNWPGPVAGRAIDWLGRPREHSACDRCQMRSAMRSLDQLPHWSSNVRPSCAADFGDFVRSLRGLFDPYRPERHYMRGPGPKWRAKHSPAAALFDPAFPSLSGDWLTPCLTNHLQAATRRPQ